MNTLTEQKQKRKSESKDSQQRRQHLKQQEEQQKEQQKEQQPNQRETAPGIGYSHGEGLHEGLYAQVKQDERLREQHVARLLETDGYGHLSADEASDITEQMLRLCTLLYEMLQSGQNQKQVAADLE